MCIFVTKYKYFNFGDQIVKSLNGSGIPYFKLITKNKTVKRIKTLKTIKFIHSLFSYNCDRKYVLNGKSVIYLNSIPKPKLIKTIKIYNNKVNNNKDNNNNVEDVDENLLNPEGGTGLELVKSLCGLKYSDKRKAKIMNKIRQIFPIELRSILFKFAMKYLDTFVESDLHHFEQLLEINSENSIILDCLLCRNNSNALIGNQIFLKLLKFVSSTHPRINQTNFKDSININV